MSETSGPMAAFVKLSAETEAEADGELSEEQMAALRAAGEELGVAMETAEVLRQTSDLAKTAVVALAALRTPMSEIAQAKEEATAEFARTCARLDKAFAACRDAAKAEFTAKVERIAPGFEVDVAFAEPDEAFRVVDGQVVRSRRM